MNAEATYETRLLEAQKFLERIDSAAQSWTFQTFDDNKARRDASLKAKGHDPLARVFHGTLEEHAAALERFNDQGAGVYVTINETDGRGRKAENITRVRAAWVDLDGSPLDPCRQWEEPHVIVETSPGRWHAYWLVDGLELDQFRNVQERLIAAFGADKSVHDLPRVMRLPGFYHRKGEPGLVREIKSNAFPAPHLAGSFLPLLDDLPAPPRPEVSKFFDFNNAPRQQHIDTGSASSDRPTQAEVAEALDYIDPDADGYSGWCDILMALHHEFGPGGLALAEDWSRRGAKYRHGEVAAKFASFTAGGKTTIKTVFARAKENGCDLRALAKKHRPSNNPRGNPKRTPPKTPTDDSYIEITEDGVARHFTRQHQDRLRFDHDMGKWFEWSGDHWAADSRARAFNFCREAAHKASVDASSKELSTARRASFASGVERMAKADPAHAVTQEVWDKDPWLIGVPGGVVDLINGRMRPADPADMITKRCAVAPSLEHDCPRWLRFLDEATGGDFDLMRFLQQWTGYSLTGITREHALVFMYGGGGNGKSVFLNTVSGMIGDYATQASMDTFTASKHERHPTDLAALRGARIVTASETEEGRAWAEARIKALTGGDKISARFMRQDFFEFTPQFKLIIAGNHRPTLRNIDAAMQRRLNIVPFIRKPANPDRELENKLREEWPGILRWAIDGCLDWQRDGLIRPASVTAATAAYFEENDLFGAFLEEHCETDPNNDRWFEPAAEFFKRWQAYALAAGDEPMTARWLGENMARRGFVKHKKKLNGRTESCFLGVKLKEFVTYQDFN